MCSHLRVLTFLCLTFPPPPLPLIPETRTIRSYRAKGDQINIGYLSRWNISGESNLTLVPVCLSLRFTSWTNIIWCDIISYGIRTACFSGCSCLQLLTSYAKRSRLGKGCSFEHRGNCRRPWEGILMGCCTLAVHVLAKVHILYYYRLDQWEEFPRPLVISSNL